jgi:hypothetical protein
VAEDHVTLPFSLPPLDHLTTTEVGQLRGRVQVVSREARKKATQILTREPSLKKAWGRSISMGKNTTPEERAEIQRDLERELLRCPEAYLAHAWANSLVTLDIHCRDELLRRTGSVNPKKKTVVEAVRPVVESPPAPKPLPEPPGDEIDGSDLAAMFDQAHGDE